MSYALSSPQLIPILLIQQGVRFLWVICSCYENSMLCMIHTLHTIPIQNVTHSDESFPMCPFQTQQEFTTTWKGFKQQTEMKASNVPIPNMTTVHNCMKRFQATSSILDSMRIWRWHVLRKIEKTGAEVERSQRKSLAQLAWQMHLPAPSAGKALNCCVCSHVRQE